MLLDLAGVKDVIASGRFFTIGLGRSTCLEAWDGCPTLDLDPKP